MKKEFEYIKHNQIQNLKIFLVTLKHREQHIHSDLELIYVLDGSVRLHSKSAFLSLNKNQFALINPFQVHEIQADQNALILAIQISTKFCKDYYPRIQDMEFDFCIGNKNMSGEVDELLFAIATVLSYHYFLQEDNFELHCVGLLNLFFSLLIRNVPLHIISTESRMSRSLKNDRIQRIISFMETSFQDKILLSDLAKTEKLTIPYLSHFFRDQLGMSFQEYLTDLRCEKARQLLLLTDYNLTTVSMESGFSGSKYLNRAFYEKYMCSPAQYRSQFMEAPAIEPQILATTSQEFLSAKDSLSCLDNYYHDAKRLLADPIIGGLLW